VPSPCACFAIRWSKTSNRHKKGLSRRVAQLGLIEPRWLFLSKAFGLNPKELARAIVEMGVPGEWQIAMADF
jgi:hypothetical protein